MVLRCFDPGREPAAGVGVVSLVHLAAGASGAVHLLQGGRMLASRLAALGLSAGAEVTVVRNDRSGPLIVLVRGTRVALGRGEASKILVEVAADAGAGSGG